MNAVLRKTSAPSPVSRSPASLSVSAETLRFVPVYTAENARMGPAGPVDRRSVISFPSQDSSSVPSGAVPSQGAYSSRSDLVPFLPPRAFSGP